MKILCLHANSITYKATKKAIKEPEEIDSKEGGAKDCLVVFMSVEKADEGGEAKVAKRTVDEVHKITKQLGIKNVVLYPYVHLTNKPSKPSSGLEVLNMAYDALKKEYDVSRSPFGWYKSFNIDVKGHPLAELSREFGPDDVKKEKVVTSEKFEMHEANLSKEDKINLTLAAAIGESVKELFPKAEIGGIGFYHDQSYVDIYGIDLKQNQFGKIEKQLKEILAKGKSFKKADPDNKFQKEIVKDCGAKSFKLDKVVVTPTYKDALVSTKDIKAFKLMNLSSAYWKGSSKNPQLYRIYAIGFSSQKLLDKYLADLAEAEARDHRKIGTELDLYSFNDITPGNPFFHPKGAIVYTGLMNFLRDHYPEWGYEEVITPLIYDSALWQKSGHWGHYQENMFLVDMDNKPASLKPMNCPSHILIYKTKRHSYRELPRRITDFAPLHRNELKGTLGGLMRVRKFSQDDCHVFCTPEQIKEEIKAHIKHCQYVYKDVFGFDFHIELSTKPEKAMGDPKMWELAEKSLKEALDENKVKYKLNPGDGAFYGPKIDFHIKDALGRSWQCGTEQLDFQMPERFDVTYEGKDGQKHRAVMLHRTVLGSVERFMGILVEHFAGKFPTWLNPVQVKVITVNDASAKFAEKIYKKLRENKIRVEFDDRNETIGKKIREAQLERVNYMLTIGDKEVSSKTLAVRDRSGKTKFGVDPDKFVENIVKEIKNRS